MRVTSKKRLRVFWETHADAGLSLRVWFKIAGGADWQSIQDVRKQFPGADGVTVASGRTLTVFNVKGNRYRLIADILHHLHLIHVCEVMTHAQYDEDRWKDRL